MSRFNRNPSPAYREFVETVREFAARDQEPGENVRRAIAEGLEDHLRERFKNAWKVDERADTACFRRLVTGEDECNCDRSWIDRNEESGLVSLLQDLIQQSAVKYAKEFR
ncbi:hypothetical protein [Halocatena halophila]|uniref:hypothetical protein n=1 Tax=Halocatena halophila TaxID=2814576 RepID=UPI002ED22BEE